MATPSISSRDFKNLKSVARAYGSRLLSAVYRESSEEWVRLEANLHKIELPARVETRKSIAIDRCLIPDARVGWTVNLFASANYNAKPLASGQVRKFLQREGRQDLTILRLASPLNMKQIIDKQPESESSFFVVLYASVENPTLLRRCLHTYFAIDQFMRLRCSESVAKLLIGDLYPNPITWRHPPAELLSPSTIDFKLTREQNRALQIAIKKHITIIEGTVGSGKTHLAACIAYILAVQRFQKVLICSQAVGTIELLAKLLMTNETSCDDSLSVIQISDHDNDPLKFARRNYDVLEQATTSENKQHRRYIPQGKSKQPLLRGLMMQQMTKSCKLNHLVGWDLYRRFLDKHSAKGSSYSDQIDIERLTEKNVAMCCKTTRKKAEYRLLDRADIVCCTLEQSGRKLISRHQFDVLIIDDAHLPSDAEILIPLMYPNLKQIILLGQDDIKLNQVNRDGQLRKQSLFINRNLGQERYKLFSRLVNSYGPLAKLTQQFRGHEKLMEFCNGNFYKSKLRTHPNASRRYVRNCVGVGDFTWLPKVGNTMNVLFGNSTSNFSRNYLIIEKIINNLVKLEKYPKSAITVVTNLDHLQNISTHRVCLAGVELRNVLDIVGLENEFIILCCQQPTVKSHRLSYEIEPDFTRNDQALHIAITRAKLGLFIVADQCMLDSITNNQSQNNCESLSNKSVVWIDQESSDYCAKWRALVRYHRDMGTMTEDLPCP